MNCPRCNADVTAQDKFCPSCGYPMENNKPGGGKKPNKRAYEEASTQLVDVDEFRKYMAEEKYKVNLAGGEAGSAAPAAAPEAAVAPAAAPASKDLNSLSPEALKASGTYEPAQASKSQNPLMLVVGLLVLAAVAYLGFKLMGGSDAPAENAPMEAQPAGAPAEGAAAPAPAPAGAPAEGAAAPAPAPAGAPAEGAAAPAPAGK